MPLYFSLSCRIHPQFRSQETARALYDAVIAAGFHYGDTYPESDAVYGDVCAATLAQSPGGELCEGPQVLFNGPWDAPLRAFWLDGEDGLILSLILPEPELYPCCCCLPYYPDRFDPLLYLARRLWDTGLIGEISGCNELNGGLRISRCEPGAYRWVQLAVLATDAFQKLDLGALSVRHDAGPIHGGGMLVLRRNFESCPYCKGDPAYSYASW